MRRGGQESWGARGGGYKFSHYLDDDEKVIEENSSNSRQNSCDQAGA